MKYTKFFKFLEKKDHLINKLTSLTPEQKQEVIAFFNKHPNYENEINWNRNDLTYEDFEEIMNKERISGTKLSEFVKEGRHYLLLYKSKNLMVYQPLTWMGSRYIASEDVAPYIEGTWCTAYQKKIVYWNRYSFNQRESFLYLCTPTTKWALEINIKSGKFISWDALDNKHYEKNFYSRVIKEVPNIKEILEKLIPQAIDNYNLVVDSREIDKRDNAILEKNKELAREALIKAFSKSFLKQVRGKGYYQWSGSLNLNDLQDLGLYDKETGFFDEKVSKFKVIGNVDFKYCTAKQIYLPQYIEKSFTLENSRKLNSIVIPDGVTSIDDWAFTGCKSLTKITIPDSVTSIGNNAFHSCSSLTSITIPDSVTSIGRYAFYFCSSLTEVTVPDSVIRIDEFAFFGCKSLTEIAIGNSVTSIGNSAFGSCSSLTSVTIPDSVTEIGNKAFFGCSEINLTISEGSKTVNSSMTKGLKPHIISITIPDSVTSIGDYAFKGCSSLKKVYIDKEKDSLNISKAKIPPQTEIYWKGEF